MRVLIASDSFPPKVDGVSDTSAMIAAKLAARGHTVRVIAPSPGPEEGPGYRVARIGAFSFPLYPELRLAAALDRVYRLAKLPWDGAVVLTPGPIGATVLRSLPRRARAINVYTTDIPHYLEAYGLHRLSPAAERLLRWMAGRSVRTLCPTHFVEQDLQRRGFPRLEVWGRGVDTDIFNPAHRSLEMRNRLTGGCPEAPLVIFVGRLAKEKRLTELHQAALRLPAGTRFAFVGDGPERQRLEDLFANLPAVFTGYLRGAELGAAFASGDVFAFPSPTETFGQVVVQAMACGVPPVVAAGTATAELVPAGVAGLHVAPGRPEALAGAIERLLVDPGLRSSMSMAAAQYARRYSWDALMDRLETLLDPSSHPVPVAATPPFER